MDIIITSGENNYQWREILSGLSNRVWVSEVQIKRAKVDGESHCVENIIGETKERGGF